MDLEHCGGRQFSTTENRTFIKNLLIRPIGIILSVFFFFIFDLEFVSMVSNFSDFGDFIGGA